LRTRATREVRAPYTHGASNGEQTLSVRVRLPMRGACMVAGKNNFLCGFGEKFSFSTQTQLETCL